MILLRKSDERGHFDHGWLNTYHTFSFGNYDDPDHVSFRSLRVINEDFIAPSGGFGMHPHRDMEIVSYVVSGALEHEDSTGGGGVISPGVVQRMTAGRGIMHSERNPSDTETCHLIQIWIMPSERGLPPSYSQHEFVDGAPMTLLVSEIGGGAPLEIHQDARIYRVNLDGSMTPKIELGTRHAWLQVISGEFGINGTAKASKGDGAAISDEPTIELSGVGHALLFDVA